ncbi:DUF3618 domain-containing protein [Micromonospora sp. M12]
MGGGLFINARTQLKRARAVLPRTKQTAQELPDALRAAEQVGREQVVSSDPDQIRREIETTREELSNDVDALTDRVNPRRIAGDRVGQAAGVHPSEGEDDGRFRPSWAGGWPADVARGRLGPRRNPIARTAVPRAGSGQSDGRWPGRLWRRPAGRLADSADRARTAARRASPRHGERALR